MEKKHVFGETVVFTDSTTATQQKRVAVVTGVNPDGSLDLCVLETNMSARLKTEIVEIPWSEIVPSSSSAPPGPSIPAQSDATPPTLPSTAAKGVGNFE